MVTAIPARWKRSFSGLFFLLCWTGMYLVSAIRTACAQTLWLTDTAGKVFRFDGNTGAFLSSTNAGGPNNPLGIALGPDGNIYVASNNTNRNVLRYDGTTGAFLGAFTSDPSLFNDGLADIAFGPDQNLYVAVGTRGQVLRYNGHTGAFIDAFANIPNSPVGLAFGPDANLYVTPANTNQVYKVDGNTGTILDTFTSALLDRPAGLAFGADGGLYVASQFNAQVVRFNPNDGSNRVFTQGGALIAPNGVAFGPDGNLYVTTMISRTVLRYDARTGNFIDTFIPVGSGRLIQPAHLVFVPSAASVPEPVSIATLFLGVCGLLTWIQIKPIYVSRLRHPLPDQHKHN
jgi:DNA-binding beta-propeller fold protein YncE